MTLAAFQQLSFRGRLSAANRAVCLAGRDGGKYIILLFQLKSFYIEVFFSRKHKNIAALEAFDDWDRLDPYLEKIALPVCVL